MTEGSTANHHESIISSLAPWLAKAPPISTKEYTERYNNAQLHMAADGSDALVVTGGASLRYFTGLAWSDLAVDRLFALIVPKNGVPHYICPRFEEAGVREAWVLEGEIHLWDEHEDAFALAGQVLHLIGAQTIAIDPLSPFTVGSNLQRAMRNADFIDATALINGCRTRKSPAEIALLQQAKDMTLEVHRRTAEFLTPGISTSQVRAFVNDAHRALGAERTAFAIVLFGKATSFPHGVPYEQYIQEGDVVLIDTGCTVQGYNSDITRTYVFGSDIDNQIKDVWDLEKEAQAAAFAAAQVGVACEDVDRAARDVIEKAGLGPDYQLPGLPHRTGHGIGLSVHEAPYLVRGEKTPLQTGMCFSNEPMIVVPNHFGIRLEDHFYMTEEGPKWFTEPSLAIDAPFG